jgi:low affinity Fe/Cu permease
MFLSYSIMSVTKNASVFTRFAKAASRAVGRPAAFTIALATLVLWAASGPLFGFSDTWQLIINTGTTIVTFLMVFLIQNTQNRDAEAMHVKLDELIRANKTAHNALLDLEDLEEDELDRIRADYERLAAQARGELKRRKPARAKRERPQKQPPQKQPPES